MRYNFIPVFNNASTSAMNRIFGDFVQSTEIREQDNTLSKPLLSFNDVEIRVRLFYWSPSYAPKGTVTTRFECYYKGVLVDYSLERLHIIKTFRWLTKNGQIHA